MNLLTAISEFFKRLFSGKSMTHYSSRLTYFSSDLVFLAATSRELAIEAFEEKFGRPPKYLVEMSPHDLGPMPIVDSRTHSQLTVFEMARRMEDEGRITSLDRGYVLQYPLSFFDPVGF